MSCREHASLVDYARGVAMEADRRVALEHHVATCPRCAQAFERERALSAELGRLASEALLNGASSHVAQAVIRAFDEAWVAGRPDRSRVSNASVGRWSAGRIAQFAAVAALVTVTCVAGAWWLLARHPDPQPTKDSTTPNTPASIRVAATGGDSANPPRVRVTETDPAVASFETSPRASVVAPKRRVAVRSRPREDASEFVPWPNAEALPAFESGELLRLDLPSSML